MFGVSGLENNWWPTDMAVVRDGITKYTPFINTMVTKVHLNFDGLSSPPWRLLSEFDAEEWREENWEVMDV